MLKNLLSRLKVFCANSQYGCKEAISFESLQKHEEECNAHFNEMIECDKGCGFEFVRKNPEAHGCLLKLRQKVVGLEQKLKLSQNSNIKLRSRSKQRKFYRGIILKQNKEIEELTKAYSTNQNCVKEKLEGMASLLNDLQTLKSPAVGSTTNGQTFRDFFVPDSDSSDSYSDDTPDDDTINPLPGTSSGTKQQPMPLKRPLKSSDLASTANSAMLGPYYVPDSDSSDSDSSSSDSCYTPDRRDALATPELRPSSPTREQSPVLQRGTVMRRGTPRRLLPGVTVELLSSPTPGRGALATRPPRTYSAIRERSPILGTFRPLLTVTRMDTSSTSSGMRIADVTEESLSSPTRGVTDDTNDERNPAPTTSSRNLRQSRRNPSNRGNGKKLKK